MLLVERIIPARDNGMLPRFSIAVMIHSFDHLQRCWVSLEFPMLSIEVKHRKPSSYRRFLMDFRSTQLTNFYQKILVTRAGQFLRLPRLVHRPPPLNCRFAPDSCCLDGAIQLLVEPDKERIPDLQCGGAQIAASTHDRRKDIVLRTVFWVEYINPFALCHVNGFGGFNSLPSRAGIKLLLAGICSTLYLNSLCVKKLLRFSTGVSVPPEIHPIDCH